MYLFYWLWESKIKIPNDLLDIIWPSLECAAVGELAEFLGETFEVLLGFLKLFVLLIVCGCRERQAIPDPNHWGEQHHRHLTALVNSLKHCKQMEQREESPFIVHMYLNAVGFTDVAVFIVWQHKCVHHERFDNADTTWHQSFRWWQYSTSKLCDF